MQIEQLRYFQKVAECGSMNKAAKELFCTQPAISAAIKAIEKELGMPIMERTANGIEITPFGKIVLQDTNLILGYVDRWKDISLNQQQNQSITLSLTGTSPPYTFVDFIMMMRRTHPTMNIKLEFSPSHRGHISFARDQDFRFGISYRVPAHMRDTRRFAKEHGMRIAILDRDEFCIFCNSEDELTKLNRDPVLEDLRNREVLLYQDPKMFPYFETLKKVNCKIGPQMWWEETMMLAIASRPDSIALRPRHMAGKSAFIRNGQISVLPPITDFSMPVYLLFIYPSQDRLSPAEELFMEEFRKFVPSFEVVD